MDMLIFVDTDDDIRLARRSKQLLNLVYRDIKERGRNVAKVLERYMKFVKPAFDEYIKPTRKLADIIIPRGMENQIAIDVVIQHINIQLTEYFKNKGNSEPKKAGIDHKRFFTELCDGKKYDFSDVISVFDNEKDNTVTKIFEDILDGNRQVYGEMFRNTLLDNLVKLLIKKFSPCKYPYILINDNEIDQNSSKTSNNIIYFKPTLINNEDIEKIKKNQYFTGTNKENVNVYFVSLVTTPACVENLLKEYEKSNIYFITLMLTKLFTSPDEIFASVNDQFSDKKLQKQFIEMINFVSKALKI